MTALTKRCDDGMLRRLLDDALTPAEERAVVRHLDDCELCRRRLEELAAEPAEWDVVRALSRSDAARSLDGPASDSPLHAAMVAATSSGDAPTRRRADLTFLAPTDDPEMLGRLGPYEVVGLVGRGGMGLVLKAFDRSLGRFVAVKVLAPQLAACATARQRFAREARAAAAVVHEHVVPIHAVAEHAGLPYLVMPYLRGQSLQQRIDADGPLSVSETLRIGRQVALGLAAAHAQGLVHRDVKPANVLLESGIERAMITDFGLARTADDAGLTATGVVAGTPHYMAPEQARGEPADHRSDLFGLGGVLYAAYTGRHPFRGESPLAILKRVCEEDPTPIRSLNPEVPTWVADVIAKLMAKEPADRFRSASEAADVLERCLAHLQNPTLSPHAPRVGPRLPAVRRVMRRSLRHIPIAILAAALVILLIREFRPARNSIGQNGAGRGVPFGATHRESFSQDFRNNTFDDSTLGVLGPRQYLRPEPTGLHVAVPAGETAADRVGVSYPFRLIGDCEIRASVELLDYPTPPTGYGTGAAVLVEDGEGAGASLQQVRMPAGPEHYIAHRYVRRPDGEYDHDTRSFPTVRGAVTLRLRREGSLLRYEVSEGGGESFRELCSLPFTDRPLTAIEFYGQTGGTGNALEARLLDLRIETEKVSLRSEERTAPKTDG